MTPTLAIFGVGKMGGAILAGLLASGAEPATLRMVEPGPDAGRLAREHGVAAVSAAEAAGSCDVLVLAVKPRDVAGVLGQLDGVVDAGRHLLLSVAAGVPAATIEARLPAATPVVRAMPNTPVLVGEGMTAIAAGRHATTAHLDTVEGLLAPVSRVVRLPEESLDAVTALSGSGPAYFFLLAEALADAGVLLGLPRATALELIAQTAVGAAKLLRESGDSPAVLRDAVSSPAGTTIAGVRALEDQGLRAAVFAAAEAARDRSRQLSLEFG